MAGEDYVSPINGKTYRVPKYEEPADAPVAFKDFADNLPPGGIDFEPDRIGQVVQSLDGAEWDKGMSLNVVDAVPADDDANYAIGDVVFVTGPGDGGSPLPGVGGGKVLQVVSGTHNTEVVTTSTTYIPTGLKATITPSATSSRIMIVAQINATQNGTVFSGAQIGLFRGDETGTLLSENEHFVSDSPTNGNVVHVYLDDPSTTGPQMYSLALKTNSANTEVKTCTLGWDANIVLQEVSA